MKPIDRTVVVDDYTRSHIAAEVGEDKVDFYLGKAEAYVDYYISKPWTLRDMMLNHEGGRTKMVTHLACMMVGLGDIRKAQEEYSAYLMSLYGRTKLSRRKAARDKMTPLLRGSEDSIDSFVESTSPSEGESPTLAYLREHLSPRGVEVVTAVADLGSGREADRLLGTHSAFHLDKARKALQHPG